MKEDGDPGRSLALMRGDESHQTQTWWVGVARCMNFILVNMAKVTRVLSRERQCLIYALRCSLQLIHGVIHGASILGIRMVG